MVSSFTLMGKQNSIIGSVGKSLLREMCLKCSQLYEDILKETASFFKNCFTKTCGLIIQATIKES